MAKTQYRIRFVVDEDASFEECNGEARPLTEDEYLGNEYRACPEHMRTGSKVIKPARGKRPALVGCASCGRPGAEYVTVPYVEYLAFYGNPDCHVYLEAELQRECRCCGVWSTVDTLGHIDMMDISPEYLYLTVGGWYTFPKLDLKGYLHEVATEMYREARRRKGTGAARG